MSQRQLAFFFNQQRCTGCLTCQVACQDKNDLPAGLLYRQVREMAGGGFAERGAAGKPEVYAYYLSMSCNHCREPACVRSCPTGALQKRREDGIVCIDRDRCSGCRRCAGSCPYGAPRYDPDQGKTGKCDFCHDLLARGEPPACVAACPMRALAYGTLAELTQEYGGGDWIRGLPDPELTKPSLLLAPHRDAAR